MPGREGIALGSTLRGEALEVEPDMNVCTYFIRETFGVVSAKRDERGLRIGLLGLNDDFFCKEGHSPNLGFMRFQLTDVGHSAYDAHYP